jgi:hypothetical protein
MPERRRSATASQAKITVKKIRTPAPAEFYAAELAARRLPSIRQVKPDLKVGQTPRLGDSR